MIKISVLVSVVLFTCLQLGAGTASEYSFDSYMNRDYHVTDERISTLAYYIVASKPQTLEEGFDYLRSEKEGNIQRSKVFSIMGLLLSAYPTNKYDTDIETYLRSVESSYEHFSEIIKAYSALAQIGTMQTLQMLKDRATYDFWEGRMIPSLTDSFSEHTDEHTADNAQSVAIVRLGSHPLPEAQVFLKKLQDNQKYLADPVLQENESLKYGLEATKWVNEHQNQINEALVLKKSIFGTEDVKSEAFEKASDFNEVVEVVEELTPSESASWKSVEVTSVETSEGLSERLSNWWLWLFGLGVAIVGWLALAEWKS